MWSKRTLHAPPPRTASRRRRRRSRVRWHCRKFIANSRHIGRNHACTCARGKHTDSGHGHRSSTCPLPQATGRDELGRPFHHPVRDLRRHLRGVAAERRRRPQSHRLCRADLQAAGGVRLSSGHSGYRAAHGPWATAFGMVVAYLPHSPCTCSAIASALSPGCPGMIPSRGPRTPSTAHSICRLRLRRCG